LNRYEKHQKETHQRLCHTDTRAASASAGFQVPVPNEEGCKAGETGSGDDNDKGPVEGSDVGAHDGLLELLGEGEDDGDGLADGVEGLGRDGVRAGGVLLQVVAEFGAEDSAGDGDADGATDELEEGDEGSGLGDRRGLVRVLGLDGDDGVLEGDTGAGAEEDLVADELRAGGVDVDRIEEATGGGGNEGANDEPEPVVTRLVDNAAGDGDGDDGGEHEGDDVDATLGGCAALGLVEEGEVVGRADEDEHEEEGLGTRADLGAPLEHAEGHHRAGAHVVFPGDEESEDGAELRENERKEEKRKEKKGKGLRTTAKQAMTALSPQGLVWPPHWRARRSGVMVPRERTEPSQSSDFHFWRGERPWWRGDSTGGRAGSQMETAAMEMAPKGRLM
jgi:hypothetical protein